MRHLLSGQAKDFLESGNIYSNFVSAALQQNLYPDENERDGNVDSWPYFERQ